MVHLHCQVFAVYALLYVYYSFNSIKRDNRALANDFLTHVHRTR